MKIYSVDLPTSDSGSLSEKLQELLDVIIATVQGEENEERIYELFERIITDFFFEGLSISMWKGMLSYIFEELADRMTMSGLEVENLDQSGKDISKVVVGEIIAVNPHPNAERLVLCDVNVGDRQLHIVCGARNMGETAADGPLEWHGRMADDQRQRRGVAGRNA